MLHISRKHQTPEQQQGPAGCGELYLNTVVNCQLQVNYTNPLLY